MPVWPNDEPFDRVESQRLEQGDPVNLSQMTLSVHAGAHMDAPSHFLQGGPTIDEIDLGRCMGPARVVSVPSRHAIGPDDLDGALTNMPPRILIRSMRAEDAGRFSTDFSYFRSDTAEALVGQGIVLVGTDAPSIDRFDSTALESHRIFGAGGVVILENLLLTDVPDGDYELIALPLRIVGAEASPVRAVLKQLD